MKRETRQRMLQVGMGLGLLFLAFLVERVAIEPPGIYFYSRQGYKGFTMGLSREGVLGQINQIRSIRTLLTCDPETELKLTSRREFEMNEALIRSDIWTCQAKKEGTFLFYFQDQKLNRILRVKGKPLKGQVPFDPCSLGTYQDLDQYLVRQTSFTVFYEEGS